MLPTCGLPLSDKTVCGRPAGHTSWSLHAGYPDPGVSAAAHSTNPQDYDHEVAPWLFGSEPAVTA